MAKNNFLKPDKITLAKWVDKALQQYLKKENIKFGFSVFTIWPLNSTSMAKKFGPSEVFIVTEEEDLRNSYHSYTIMQTNNNEDGIKTTTKLLNIARTFQGIVAVTPTKTKCPSSPTPHYYVEMPCNPTMPTTNPKLVVNLEDLFLESHDLNVSYQTQQIPTLTNLLSLPRLPTRRTLEKEQLIDYFSSRVVTFNQYLAVLKQKAMSRQRGCKQS
jgi:hypothetical protein